MGSRFQDLDAYRLSVELANELHAAAALWPPFDRWSVGMQLVRAADSVGANIAEAAGRLHRPDRLRILLIARGSLYEVEHFVGLAEERGLMASATEQVTRIAETLNGLIRHHRSS